MQYKAHAINLQIINPLMHVTYNKTRHAIPALITNGY